MNVLSYAQPLHNEKNQEQLISVIQSLLTSKLADKSDYAQEKFVKSFSESIANLESNLLRQNKIHPHEIKHDRFSINQSQFHSKHHQVEKQIEVAIRRQFRHFLEFL